MATVANLERLESLIKRLKPLSEKQRGEVIEAANWNQLIDAVVEVARETLAERGAETVATHGHADQVEIGWLDGKLRGLVLEGGLRDPAAEAQLAGLSRKFDRLSKAVEELNDRFGTLKSSISTVETRDIERHATLNQVTRRLDGAFDSRDDVSSLRQSLRTLDGQIRTAVELGRRLESPDGGPIDLGDLAERIGTLEALRADLTLPDGTAFTAAAHERDLAALRAELVTEAGLKAATDDLRRFVEEEQRDAILEEARTTTLSTIKDALTGLSNDLDALMNRRIEQLDETIAGKIESAGADIEGRITATLQTERRAELNAALAAATEKITAQQEASLAALEARIGETRAKEISALRQGLELRLDEILAGRLQEVSLRIGAAEGRLSTMETRTTGNASDIKTVSTQMQVAIRDLKAADAKTNETLSTRITELERRTSIQIDTRVNALRDGLRTDLQTDMTAMRRDMEGGLNENIRRNTATEVSLAANRLQNDVSAIASSEIDVLRGDLETQIERGIAVNQARLAGLVADEVRRATAGMDAIVRRQVEAFMPEIDRRIDRRLAQRSSVR